MLHKFEYQRYAMTPRESRGTDLCLKGDQEVKKKIRDILWEEENAKSLKLKATNCPPPHLLRAILFNS